MNKSFGRKGFVKLCLMSGLLLLSHALYSQVPNNLRIPERGEAPRYPQDLMIGELGQGRAPTESYRFAHVLLSALRDGRNDHPAFGESSSTLTAGVAESVSREISAIGTRSYRIGGGRPEPDGSISFIVRFIGAEESIAGELFVRYGETKKADETLAEEGWLFDELILEGKRALSEIRDDYRYDFSPYERFY